jgi:hypothetical protein
MIKPSSLNLLLTISIIVIIITVFLIFYPKEVKNLQTSYSVECYSGEKLIYQGKTHGKYSYSLSGYSFFDKNDTKIKVSGNCLLTEIKE